MQPLHELALPLDCQAVGNFTEPRKQDNKFSYVKQGCLVVRVPK